jgi:hypothetical protein
LDEREFIRRVVEMTIRRAMPVGLRAAASLNPKHAGALEAAAVRCEREGTREAAEAAAYAAAAVARDRVLAQYAEWVVEILIDMRAPGCEFLDLVPVVAHG